MRSIPAIVGPAALAAAALAAALAAEPSTPEAGARLDSVRAEIARLEREVAALSGKERGVLDELNRLDASLRLGSARLEEVGLRLSRAARGIAERERSIDGLRAGQDERRRYLAFRVREMYKLGPGMAVRRALGGEEVAGYLAGMRYAAYLSARDSRVLAEFDETASRLASERDALVHERARLAATRGELRAASASIESTRAARASLLDEIRRDRTRREDALAELRESSRELTAVIDGLAPRGSAPALDVRKFRGLLDWPATGSVDAGFGNVVHPRFKTVVPHPGLDIDAPEGAEFRSVFDGTVAFASWLRGYGLTVIVDHGSDLMSVYAHASVLTVEEGEVVLRGQALGRVGDTGSLRGPFLYFELRSRGEAVDPVPWLRKR